MRDHCPFLWLKGRVLDTCRLFVMAALGVWLAGCASPPQQQKVETVVEEPIDFSKRARLIDGPEGARLIFPDGLLFDFAKSTLKTEAAKNLDACMFIIDRARGAFIVEGHTDNKGPRAVNDRLSRERAEYVKAALGERKVAPSRIEIRALADTKPEVKDAVSDEQHAANRRAEIIFKSETVASLNAPHGCGEPPVKRKVMVDAPPRERTALEKVGDGIKGAVDKVTGK